MNLLFPSVEQLLSDQSWAIRLGRRLANTQADAEDLVQEGWIAALRTGPAYRQGLRPWLTATLRNLSSNQRRAENRREARHAETAVLNDTGDRCSPEEMVGQLELQRLIADLTLELTPTIREVILLRFFKGLSTVQIAQILKVPEGTIRWRLKTGLDTIRTRLDEKHQGLRRAWLPGMALWSQGPLSSARDSSLHPRLIVALMLGAALSTVGYLLIQGRKDRQHQNAKHPSFPLQDQNTAAVSGNKQGLPSNHARLVLPDETTTSSNNCAARLTAKRNQIAGIQPDFIATVQPRTLFGFGSTNPTATAALAPILAEIMKAGPGVPDDYTLECRTWSCRMTVLLAEESKQLWKAALQKSPEIYERTGRTGFSSGSPLRDPVSGRTFFEKYVHFCLADPSGKRIPHPPKEQGLPMVVQPVVDTPLENAETCLAELAEADRLLARMTLAIARDRRLDRQFVDEPPNLRLTAEIDNNVRKNLGLAPSSTAVTVECRGQICRVSPDPKLFPDLNVFQKRLETPDFVRRIERGISGREKYYLFAPSDVAIGMDLAKLRLGELLSTPPLRDCESQHQPTGELIVKLVVPRTGEENDDGEPAKVSKRVGGSLANTPFAHCLEAALATILMRTPLPEKVTGASLTRRVNYEGSRRL